MEKINFAKSSSTQTHGAVEVSYSPKDHRTVDTMHKPGPAALTITVSSLPLLHVSRILAKADVASRFEIRRCGVMQPLRHKAQSVLNYEAGAEAASWHLEMRRSKSQCCKG